MPLLWHVIDECEPSLRCWEGDFVVYNGLSGNTHILDIVSGTVLSNIVQEPCTQEGLYRIVADFLEVPVDEKLEAIVNDITGRLRQAYLIEESQTCS